MKSVRVAMLSAALVCAAASPAAAGTAVLANQRYAWFYWIAPILAFSAVGLILFLWGGYIKKVLFPKYRGRKVEE